MNYLKFTSYAYLLVGIFLATQSYIDYKNQDINKAIIWGMFSLSCFFLFFFRRRFAKKFEDRNKKP